MIFISRFCNGKGWYLNEIPQKEEFAFKWTVGLLVRPSVFDQKVLFWKLEVGVVLSRYLMGQDQQSEDLDLGHGSIIRWP